MVLPTELTVQLHAASPEPRDLGSILVALDVHIEGRYYWGTLLGLTDSHGEVRISAARLTDQFAEEVSLFPMDYKVTLDHCDPRVTVRVIGGRDFQTTQATAARESPVTPWARDMWSRARNAPLSSAAADAVLAKPATSARVELGVSLNSPRAAGA